MYMCTIQAGFLNSMLTYMHRLPEIFSHFQKLIRGYCIFEFHLMERHFLPSAENIICCLWNDFRSGS